MQLKYESKIMKSMEGSKFLYNEGKGIPKIYWHGSDGEYYVMVMQLFSSNLEELFNSCGRRFSVKSTLIIGSQFVIVNIVIG